MKNHLLQIVRVIKILSDNFAYAWKPMQFSQGAVYLYKDTNMSCKFITYKVYLYTDIGPVEVEPGKKLHSPNWMLSSCRPVLLSSCPHILMSSCPPVLLSCWPHVLLSSCPSVLLFLCPTILLSSCLYINTPCLL